MPAPTRTEHSSVRVKRNGKWWRPQTSQQAKTFLIVKQITREQKTGSDLNKVEVAGLMSMEREPNIWSGIWMRKSPHYLSICRQKAPGGGNSKCQHKKELKVLEEWKNSGMVESENKKQDKEVRRWVWKVGRDQITQGPDWCCSQWAMRSSWWRRFKLQCVQLSNFNFFKKKGIYYYTLKSSQELTKGPHAQVSFPKIFLNFRYNSYTIKFTILKCIIQWFSVHSQSCASVTTI